MKLSVNELRIGNFVNRLGKQTVIKVIQHTEQVDFVSTPLSGAITINQIEPIPLTEEWLIKLPDDVGIIPLWVDFVHQLQNWYWVKNKCEKELIFK